MLHRTELLRIFCCAAESASFREAANRLGISPQAVTRAVQELEAQFGEPLFHRSTRQVRITAFGEQLAAEARPALGSVEQLFQRHSREQRQDLAGSVRITAPHSLGRNVLVPLLAPLLRKYPQIKLDLRLSELIADSVDERIDIGVRIGFVRDRSYIARVIAPIHLQVVAAPALLQQHGMPDNVQALQDLPLSALIDHNTGRIWPWYFANQQQFVPGQPAFTTDDQESECAAALAGLCVAQLPDYLVTEHLAGGRLQAVLGDAAPEPFELFIYRPQRGPVAARVRLVYDHLFQQLGAALSAL